MPGFAALALANKHGAAIGIEIAGAQTSQLAIPAAGMQRGLDEIPEIPLCGIYKLGDFIFREITEARRLYLAEWLDGAPWDIRCNFAVAKGLI
jgi:hypothetical protein